MEQVRTLDAATLSKAVVLWSGWRDAARPLRDRSRLVPAFGQDRADELMSQIREIADEFYASDARFVATDLGDMAHRAIKDFRQRRADLSEAALQALAWCYTWDYK